VKKQHEQRLLFFLPDVDFPASIYDHVSLYQKLALRPDYSGLFFLPVFRRFKPYQDTQRTFTHTTTQQTKSGLLQAAF